MTLKTRLETTDGLRGQMKLLRRPRHATAAGHMPEVVELLVVEHRTPYQFLPNNHQSKSDFIVMHPLPRVNEIAIEVDDDPRAKYFDQVQNGRFMRMALILKMLGLENEVER